MVGIGVLVFGLLPILDGAGRIAVIVAGVLLLLAATSRSLSRRTGDGDPRSPQDRTRGGTGGGGGGQKPAAPRIRGFG